MLDDVGAEPLRTVWMPAGPDAAAADALRGVDVEVGVAADPFAVSGVLRGPDAVFLSCPVGELARWIAALPGPEAGAAEGPAWWTGTPAIAVLAEGAPDSEVDRALEAGAFDVVRRPLAAAEVRSRALAARRFRKQCERTAASERHSRRELRRQDALATRLAAAEAELARCRADLRRSEQLAAVGTFAAGIAHQVNNPLTGVVGFSELLLLREDLPADALADLERVVAEAKRAARILREMHELARSCTRSEAVALHGLLDETLALPQVARSLQGVDLRRDLPGPEPVTRGDGLRLQQVFLNLLENAAHALDGRSEPRLTVSSQREGGSVRLRFEDNGPGIDEEARRQLFSAFFTTKTREGQRGSGLGLAVSRAIVREQSGSIHHEPTPGGGATFVVTLPLAPSPDPA